MTTRLAATPAFGEADLSNCEREQIHLAGSIQPHGALLLAREPDLLVVQASANAAALIGVDTTPVGRTLDDLGGTLASVVRAQSAQRLDTIPVATRATVGAAALAVDLMIHRPPEGGIVVEIEPTLYVGDQRGPVAEAIKTVLGCFALRSLADEAARIFQTVSGFDRVMVYRFDETGHGEVFAEQCRPHLEAYLGNRYPASDIPEIARRLYLRNRVRAIADVEFTPVPLVPTEAVALDMSLCILRASSPIHIQYLRNMGVRATLVVSLVVGGKLWGLISCHHYEPRPVAFEVRAVCELIAEIVATRIAALECFARGQSELSVRRLEQRMVEAISRDGDWRAALFDGGQALLQPLAATGAALLFEGQVLTLGDVPSTAELRALAAWLDGAMRDRVFHTASLGTDAAAFDALIPVASGVVAVRIAQTSGEYLLWVRPERVRTVTWGGDPFKPVVVGNDPRQLSPRRSFAQWHQVVEGTSDPWTAAELTAARQIGDTVADVILQFRSVRMLIAQDQLEQVRREVGTSDQPVVVADATGTILLANDAFARLLPPAIGSPRHLDALPAVLREPTDAPQRLRDLMRTRRVWRGEVSIVGEAGTVRPMLVRADPIFAGSDRVLGFVLMFTDLTEQKQAEAARRKFQESILDGHRGVGGRVDGPSDVLFQTVLASVVENAQLAALEITDGLDTATMPDMLDGVRASVARTIEVLADLLRHASGDGGPVRR